MRRQGHLGALNKAWPLLFLLCALPVVVVSAVLTPLGQSPDEPAHLVRAAGLLHGAVLPARRLAVSPDSGKPIEQSGVKIDAGLMIAGFGKTSMLDNRPVATAEDLIWLQSIPWMKHPFFASIPNTAAYFPLAYLPASIGLAMGKLAGMSPYWAIILARLMMGAVYLLTGCAALAVAVFGRGFLLAILLLPMSLFLGGTLNQDGLLTALICLACAGLTRGSSRGRRLALAALLAVLLAKPPYLPLLGIFALPLAWPGFWRRAGQVALASLPVLLWGIIAALFIAVPFGKPLYHPGPLLPGGAGLLLDRTDAALNLHILLADKARFFTLPWHSLALFGADKIREMIGVLGLLQLSFPDWFYHLWEAALAIALLGAGPSRSFAALPTFLALLNHAAVLAILILTGWLIMLSFYLSWTNAGVDFIDGLQGRYALLLLPFLLFARPALLGWLPEKLAAVPALAMGIFGVGYIPLKLVSFYYLH